VDAQMKERKMKKILCFLFMVILLVPALVSAGGKNPWQQKLPFKNATIEYTLSGVEKGTETLYVRKYGEETAQYHKTTTTMMGMTMVNETIEIIDPDWIYTFDLTEQSGAKSANPQKYMIEEYNKLSKAEKKQVLQNSEELAAAMPGGMNAKIEKNAEKILGYDCDKVTMMGTTVYTIHETSIPLKSEANVMGMMMKIEATKIDKGSVSKKFFKHPEGITPVMDPESDAMARAMAKQTMDMLKDPEAAKKASEMKPAPQSPNQQEMSPEEQQQMEKAMEALKGIFGS
jgi:hypothetical protein